MNRFDLLKQRSVREGAENIPDSELLLTLSECVAPATEMEPLVRELMVRFGSLKRLLNTSSTELAHVLGDDSPLAGLITVLREVAARHNEPDQLSEELLRNPKQMERYLITRFRGVGQELLLWIFLDRQGVVLGEEMMGAGTVDQVFAFPRQVMKAALDFGASALIMVHNHPHGPPLPSHRDREEAERMRDILRPFDLTLEHAIIVGENRCFSIFDNRAL